MRAIDCLGKVVGAMLHKRGLSLSVAESCTGGLIANLITDVPGSSEYFNMGAVTYSNQSKQEILGVPREILGEHGAVSDAVVRSMANGVRRVGCSAYRRSGYGYSWSRWWYCRKTRRNGLYRHFTEDGCDAKKYVFNRDRIWFKQFVAATALDTVRRLLIL